MPPKKLAPANKKGSAATIPEVSIHKLGWYGSISIAKFLDVRITKDSQR